MEIGAHVWLRSSSSQWGWVPAYISNKEPIEDAEGTVIVVRLTLTDDPVLDSYAYAQSNPSGLSRSGPHTIAKNSPGHLPYFETGLQSPHYYSHEHRPDEDVEEYPRTNSALRTFASSTSSSSVLFRGAFTITMDVDPEQLKRPDGHADIKLRNIDSAAIDTEQSEEAASDVNDLISLTHLHEPAILHSLRIRYDKDIIYTSTGPILIAVNPFKAMKYLYSEEMIESYRRQGEGLGAQHTPMSRIALENIQRRNTPTRQPSFSSASKMERLPPHVYQTADDAYRAMLRGLETHVFARFSPRARMEMPPCNQSILVSESGAGKTVTTKIVLNYLAVLSKKTQGGSSVANVSPLRKPQPSEEDSDHVTIEQQVLQSNPILEAFGNARTIRNDNSSRFGKYIDVHFTSSGKLSGATIETYLLEKVRLLQQNYGERNYHVFYQLLASATGQERQQFFLGDMTLQDFALVNSSDTYDRRDGVSDGENHLEMLDAMITIGFDADTIQSLMGLVVAVLFLGNVAFVPTNDGEECVVERNEFSSAAATLLGVSVEDLERSLITKTVLAGKDECVTVPLTAAQAAGAKEALIKALYGAAFDFIVKKINDSIKNERDFSADSPSSFMSPRAGAEARHHLAPAACIGVLDIFGFESFDVNSFEQICINYTNEALQQQFNKYVFKLEQQEYEREGILWKFISFPDNQDVLDLIDKKHTGILSLLDEQCIVPQSNDQKFTRYLYAKCDKHVRFSASATQRVAHKFSIEHYAGPVEYTTDQWLEKNKDQLPAASAELFSSSTFDLIHQIKQYVRIEQRKGGGKGGSIASKSVGAQFSGQLRTLRGRIDTTVPHYVRCLKPNDDLIPHCFEPKNIVEQLRCGGVLEAVRVSRAGYPTRYPHELFLRRYSVLGHTSDNGKGKSTHAILKSLIEQIAYDVWQADVTLIKSLRAAEKYAAASPVQSSKLFGKNLGAVEKRVQPSQRSQISNQLKELQKSYDGVSLPETKDGFMSLDFSARCAIAGIQLGKTKVFLRREAFDRIESMRSEKVSSAASAIQAIIRGRQTREYFYMLKAAVIFVQSFSRRVVGKLLLKRRFFEKNAVSIVQRAYRRYQFDKMQKAWSLASRAERQKATVVMQSIVRVLLAKCGRSRVLARKMKEKAARERAAKQKAAEEKKTLEIAATEKPRKVFVPGPKKQVPQAVELQKGGISVAPPAQKRNEDLRSNNVRSYNPELIARKNELYRLMQSEEWASVEKMFDKYPQLSEQEDPSTGELPLHVIVRHNEAWSLLIDMLLLLYPKALLHRDRMGALPIHHASAHNSVEALEIIYGAYKEGVNQVDFRGRLPLHVAAEFDAVDAVKFLLEKAPDGAYTMVHRPPSNTGGGLPLHVACRNFASIGVITALLAENFASGKRADENGDLPLHLILRCGENVDHVVVKTLLTCFSAAVSRTDMYGDLPLAIALKSRCNLAVINYLLMQFPTAASTLDGEGRSPLILALLNDAEDRTILALLNHAPYLAVLKDEVSGLTPIQVATERGHSHNVVYNLLKRDMPIDLKEKVQPVVQVHHFSWNHLVSGTNDEYHHVVTKVLQQCTQPQVLALAHVEGRDGKIALASATPVCRHEMRVMLRLFNSLEVVNQRPAYSNPLSDTQIFYALRFDVPPHHMGGNYTVLYEDDLNDPAADYLEDMDDISLTSRRTSRTTRTTVTSLTQQTSSNATVEEKLRQIRNEKGQQVIAKLTSRSEIVERELRVRRDFKLSRHYVPAILSVHHTVQHSAYSEAMAEPGFCIVLEGSDTTLENMMVDLRKAGKPFPLKALKRIGIALLHMHEHGLIHTDFGTHNIGKFKDRWKVLGVGGAVPIGDYTDPNRGFYHPPEAIELDTNYSLSKKSAPAHVVSIKAQCSYDMWAYGVVVYEATTGAALAPYDQRGKTESAGADLNKIARWDEHALVKCLRPVAHDSLAHDVLRQLLHPNPHARFKSMREVLNHPFFGGSSTTAAEQPGVGIRPPERISSASMVHRGDRIPRPMLNKQISSPASMSSMEESPRKSFSPPQPIRQLSVPLSVPLSPRSQKVSSATSPENYENGTGAHAYSDANATVSPQSSRKKTGNFAALRDSLLMRRKQKNTGNGKEQLLGSMAKR